MLHVNYADIFQDQSKFEGTHATVIFNNMK